MGGLLLPKIQETTGVASKSRLWWHLKVDRPSEFARTSRELSVKYLLIFLLILFCLSIALVST